MIKALVKSTVAASLFYTGILGICRSVLLRNKAVILMYHRVIPSEDIQKQPVQSGMYVSVDTFRMQINFLKSKFELVSLGELVKRLVEGKSIGQCCVLTFDDGWVDNFHYVYPVLQEFSVPATIFLTTGYIGTNRWFWPEEVFSCLMKFNKVGEGLEPFPHFVQKELEKSKSGVVASLEENVDSVINRLKRKASEERIEFVNKIKEISGGREEMRLLMNWDEVKEMGASGLVEFGSHTINHALLDQLSSQDVQCEIGESRKIIEKKTNQKCKFFAYPNGNYNEGVISVLYRMGFTAALSIKRGYVSSKNPFFELPRIAIHEDASRSVPLFMWRLISR